MLINLRNALMAGKRLPYDAEVEYLETDGSAYINTGAKIYNDTSVVVAWYSNYSTSTSSYFFGSDSSTDRFYLREYNGNASYSTGPWWQNTNISTVGTHTIEMSNNGISVDGTARPRTGAAKTGAGNFCLFKVAAGNSPSGMRCYSCKIYQNGVLVRDFIPVRKGTVGYLYDRVSGALFGNAGTGGFVLGPDVVPVEYIESHGTEYIDTGVPTYANARMEFGFMLNSSSTAAVFGNRIDAGRGVFFGTATNSVVYCNHSNQPISPSATLLANTEYRVSQAGNNITINGIDYSTTGAADNADSMYLFARRNGSQADRIINGRVSYFRIVVNDTPLRSFRPVRVGTEGAMMDTLTRRIYRNAGTGAFTFGNDLKYPIPAE